MPLLVDDQFDIDLNIQGLVQSICNLRQSNVKLNADFNTVTDKVHVHGLIGVDLIQFIKELKIVNCMNGSAFQVDDGIIPFGNTYHFLHPYQLGKIKVESNFNTILTN